MLEGVICKQTIAKPKKHVFNVFTSIHFTSIACLRLSLHQGGGQVEPRGVQDPQFFGKMETHTFSTNAQSRFASVGPGTTTTSASGTSAAHLSVSLYLLSFRSNARVKLRALEGPSTRPAHCIRNYRDTRTDTNLDCAFVENGLFLHLSLIAKSQYRIELS